MREEIERYPKLLLAAGLSLGLMGSLTSNADTDVTYTGDTSDSQHAQSLGANASSPGAYADVTMDYTIPDIVALAIYTNGDITSAEGAPLLSGRFTQNSSLSVSDESIILEDLVLTENVTDPLITRMNVRGVAYSSTGSINLTVEPLVEGTSTPLINGREIIVQFDNQTNSGSIDVAFNGSYVTTSGGSALMGTSSSISNTISQGTYDNNQAEFRIFGDVLEPTVTAEDDTGVYEGGVRITVTSL